MTKIEIIKCRSRPKGAVIFQQNGSDNSSREKCHHNDGIPYTKQSSTMELSVSRKFHTAFLRSTNIYDGLNTARYRLFKTTQGYFLQATTPCAVAYGYARIRRLVRLGRGR
jgi:hypothetical protein